jgi:DNA-binding MarR family transcriptional regulator
MIRNLIIRQVNFMAEEVPYFKNLPRYEVLREEAERHPEFNASACFAFLHLLKTGNELIAVDAQVLNSLGTRQGRFNLLLLVDKCKAPAPTAAELAEDTGVTRATVSGLLDGLEKEGLIERQMDSVDRRVVRVHLTPAGAALLDKVRPAYCRWFSSVVDTLNEDERQNLVSLLEKIQKQIARLAGEVAATPKAA